MREAKINFRQCLVFATAILILLLGPIGAVLLTSLCIIGTLRNFDNGLKSLTISFLIFFLNPVLISSPLTSSVALLRNLLLIVVIFKVLTKRNNWKQLDTTIVSLIFFSFMSLIILLLSSYEISISLSKLIQFSLSAIAILLAFKNTSLSSEYWKDWFYSLFITILVFSCPLYLFPQFGYSTNGVGFQGISSQPQLFGIFLAPFVALILGDLLQVRKRSLPKLIIFIVSLAVLLSTQGRTAVLAIIISIVVITIGYMVSGNPLLKMFLNPLKSKLIIVLAPLILFVSVINYEKIERGVYSFLLKRESADLRESFEISRGSQVSKQMGNIERNPVLGIGFGLPSDKADLIVQYDPFFNIPINAPAEKGTIALSIPEEMGYLGLTIFLFFLFFLFKDLFKNASLPILMAGLTAFFTNMGEATFFSFGGFGLILWLLLGMGMIAKKEERISVIS